VAGHVIVSYFTHTAAESLNCITNHYYK